MMGGEGMKSCVKSRDKGLIGMVLAGINFPG